MKKTIATVLSALLVAGAGFSLAACKHAPERSSYALVMEYFPEERKVMATMETTIVCPSDGAFDELKFELYPNAYREGAKYAPVSALYEPSAYYGGKSYGGIEITGVEGAKSFSVGGEDENILTVQLDSTLYPEESVTLDMEFTVTLAQINHRLGVGEETVNLANFYPVLCAVDGQGFCEYPYAAYGDPFVSECADYDVRLTLPDDYTVAHSGTGERLAKNGKSEYHVMAENVRDIAFVFGKDLKLYTEQVDGVTLNFYYGGGEMPQTAVSAAKDSLVYFSETFGKYPYPAYSVVETDFPYGGMEYPMLSMVSSSLAAEDLPSVVVHETAHQWWYAAVGNNQFENAWQDEGLSEYSVALFSEAHPEYGGTYEEAVLSSERSYRNYFSYVSQVNKEADTTMNRPLTSFGGEYEYRNIAYDKGVILFDRVRTVLGDRRFFAGLREYYSTYCFKTASYEQLIACFVKGGLNTEGLFHSFIDGLCVI